MRIVIILILVSLVCGINIIKYNTFIGNYSNSWRNCKNWSNGCPTIDDSILIRNKNVIVSNIYQKIRDIYIIGSNITFSNCYFNITRYFENNGTMEFKYSTIYIWNDEHNIYSGEMIINNSYIIPNSDFYINDHIIISGVNIIPTNIIIDGTLEFMHNTTLDMGYFFNITLKETGKMIIYGFSPKHIYMQQYILTCYNAFMNGKLIVRNGGEISKGESVWWFLVIPGMMDGNIYQFNVESVEYNVTLSVIIDQSLIITLNN